MNEVELLDGLLRIYSPSQNEEEAVGYLVAQMQEAGFDAFRDDAGNATGILGHGSREFVLLSHIDTVAGFIEVRREGDRLHGRGAVDAKGPLCAFIGAAARAGYREGWKIIVIGAVEEEYPTSKGAHFAGTQYKPDFCIIGEPGGWDCLTMGYRGSLLFDYTLRKMTSHSAALIQPPCEEAVTFWQRLKRYTLDVNSDKSRHFDQLQPVLLEMRSEADGFQEGAMLRINVRLPLQTDIQKLKDKVKKLADGADISFLAETASFRADKNNDLVRAFLSAIRSSGGSPRFKLKTGTSDMNILGPIWNCPIVTYGPGDSRLDHTSSESIDLHDFKRSIAILTEVLEKLTQ
ncbi:MAG: [LysW]-lysine hydrolase [Acidobacteriota bacterium]